MTFEERLASIDATLKSLLTIFSTSASASVLLGTPEAPAVEKKTRTKKTEVAEAVATTVAATTTDTRPEAVVYWVIEKHNTVYAQNPGDVAPSIEGAVQVPEAEYLVKKEEFAKKIKSAEAAQATAATAPSATATQAAAEQNSGEQVSFQVVVAKLTDLSKGKEAGQGREGVLKILNKFLVALPEAERKVPKLEPLKQNAAILAEVEALLNPAVAEVDLF